MAGDQPQICMDPKQVSFGQILEIYFSVVHDPTQLNRQGPDTGTQYRSAIFPVGAEQERVAEDARSATAQARFTGLLVVAMPTGGAIFAELLEPGFLAKLLASPPAAVLLALAAGLQVLGFLAIRRLAQVVG